METADRHWVAKHLSKKENFKALSNELTLGGDFDMHSEGIYNYAEKQNLFKKSLNEKFNFKNVFSKSPIVGAKTRLDRSKKYYNKLKKCQN